MSMRGSDLSSYVAGVDANTRAIIEAAPLHPQQLRLLLAAACGPSAATNPLRHALSPFYLMLRAFGGRPDEAATRLGTSLVLSQRCMCLIDDVEATPDVELDIRWTNRGAALRVGEQPG